MEPEKPFRWGSKISVQSKRSNISSCRSLERGSWDERRHSLSKQHTMIQVMSLEGSKKSDIYDKMLAEEGSGTYPVLPLQPLRQEESAFNPFGTVFKFGGQPGNNRLSYEQKQEINHFCLCHISCNMQNCPCFKAKEEPCQQKFCCSECIAAKSKKTVRSGMQEQDPKIFCTCKKAKCIKKYCTCYSAGVKCGQYCSCEDCQNCDKPVKMEIDSTVIVDESIKKLDMPEAMEFQPFAYRSSLQSNK